jgi:hypothetical protein
MSKKVKVVWNDLVNPSVCVVCMQPAEKTYLVTRMIYVGSHSFDVKLPVVMCDQHLAVAEHKSRAEQIAGKIGLILGILLGAAAAGGLLVYWANTQQGNWISNVLLALFIGASFFLIVWMIGLWGVAPRVAGREVKGIRRAMRIKSCTLGKPATLELEFTNELVANLFIQANQANIVD